MTISPCSGIAKRINPLFLKNVSVTHKFTVQDFYPPPPPLKKIISIYLNYNSKFLSLCTVICLGIPLIVKFLWILIYIKYEEDTASLG